MASAVPAIKELVVRSIEGLAMDRVAITLFAATGTTQAIGAGDALAATGGSGRFLGVTVPVSSVGALWLRAALLAALVAFVVFVMSRMSSGAAKSNAALAPLVTTPRVTRSP
jgi:type III secretion protein J